MQPDANAGRPHETARPPPRRIVVDASLAILHAKQRGDDHHEPEDGRHDDQRQEDENRAHQVEKWSCPAGGSTNAPCERSRARGLWSSGATTAPTRVSGTPNSRANACLSIGPLVVTTSSYSSPLFAASKAETPVTTGIASSSMRRSTPLAAAMCPASESKPSEMSIAAVAPCVASQSASLMRGDG